MADISRAKTGSVGQPWWPTSGQARHMHTYSDDPLHWPHHFEVLSGFGGLTIASLHMLLSASLLTLGTKGLRNLVRPRHNSQGRWNGPLSQTGLERASFPLEGMARWF